MPSSHQLWLFQYMLILLIKQSVVIAMGHTKLVIAEKACILVLANICLYLAIVRVPLTVLFDNSASGY